MMGEGRHADAQTLTHKRALHKQDSLNQKYTTRYTVPALHTHTCLSYTLTRDPRPMHLVACTL